MIRKAALILLLLLAGIMPPPPARAEADGGARVPVLLIHGLASHPGIWLQGEDRSFVRALQRAGYRSGRDIYFLDFSDAAGEDPYRTASERLAPFVQEILRGTGADRIDLVGHSMGGVIGRYYVELLGGDRFVRTLAMVGSPLRGSFAAGIVVRSGQVVEALSSLPADRTAELEERIREAGRRSVQAAYEAGPWEWRGRVDWAGLLGDRFLPLYLRYLSRGLLSPEAHGPGLGGGFEGWWRREDPASFQAAFFSPQAAAVPAEEGCSGKDLCAEALISRAGFHQAAVEAARAFLLASGDRTGERAEPAGAVELLRGFLPGSGTAAGHLQAAVGSRVWLGLEPDAPALLRLVEEQRPLRAEAPWLGYIPVHRELAEWNAGAEARARERPVRYLMAAGETWNLWSLFFPGVPPNDGAVEVTSAFLRPGALDALRLLPGRAAHLGLLQEEDLQRWLVPRLDPFWGEQELPARSLPGGWRLALERGGREPSVWLPPPRPPGGAFRWVDGSPAGPTAWLCPSGGMTFVHPAGTVSAGRKRALADPGSDCRLFVRDGAADPGGMLEGRAGGTRVYRLAWVAGADRTERSPAAAGVSGKADALPSGPPSPPGGRARPAETERKEVPLLEATYRSRKTSLKEERRITQAAWKISFGDGTASLVPVDGAGEKATVRHRYGQAGRYRVEAAAVADDGRELWRDAWDVETDGESTESWELPVLRESVPELRLIGPRSWITGLPADYTVEAVVPSDPHIREVSIRYDPAEHFRMLWHRPGDFRVRAAATVRIRYEIGDSGAFTLSNTYVVEVPVEVLATTLLRPDGS